MTSRSPEEGITAILFDLDGVLVDTEDLVREGWRRAAEDLGATFDEEDFQQRMLGRRTFEVLTEVFDLDPARASDLIAAGIDDKTTEVMAGVPLPAIPGAVAFVRAAKQEGLALAVVTSASPTNARLALDQIELTDVVDLVVDASQTTAGKPDPAPYLRAMDLLGHPAQTTVVFEDSPAGCTAGAQAGATVIGVATTHSATTLEAADIVIDDFRQLQPDARGARAALVELLS